MDKQGLLLCAKYAVPPNYFGYCGPKKSSNLIDQIKEKIADRETVSILSEFETLYPYLQLIAYENKIKDVFNKKVVEAYWFGNNLLKNINRKSFFSFTKEKLLLEKKLSKKELFSIKSKSLFINILPNHAFHVFNIFKQNGGILNSTSLNTVDNCRVGWGKIRIKNEELRVKNLIVETKPLIIKNNKLKFGTKILKAIKIDYKEKGLINNFKIGDWISFHWGYICDILTERQVNNLKYYTEKAVEFYNNNITV